VTRLGAAADLRRGPQPLPVRLPVDRVDDRRAPATVTCRLGYGL
jgi:hypothetical protein